METYSVQFKGKASEYFRIWIVNTFLSIITLGLYSPWAKVRNRKYLYGNTYLHGSSFDYTANPIKILKGRLILISLLILYNFGPYIHFSIPIITLVIFMGLFPWIIVKGAIFNLSNTTYRHIRFGFKRNYKESYITYIKAFLITVFTLGIGFSWAMCRHKKFIISNASIGNKDFDFKGRGLDFLSIYLRSAGLYLLFALGGGVLMILGTHMGIPSKHSALAVFAFTYIGIACSAGYISSAMINLTGNGTSLGEIKVKANLDSKEYIFIFFTNLIATIFTLGLATPWALIRTRKYKCEHIALIVADEQAFDSFIQSAGTQEGSSQDAAIDFLDIDLGF